MRIALSSRGSRGDVYPMLEIAHALAQRGHDVTLCVPPLFGQRAHELGLRARYYPEDSKQVMRTFGSDWHAAFAALRWFAGCVEAQLETLMAATEGAQVMVSSVNEVAAPTVAEVRGIPYFRVAYAPIVPGSQPPPLVPYQRLPAAVNRAMWRGINSGLRLLLGPALDRARARFGLAPVGDMAGYFAGRGHTLLALSDVLGPPAPDWRFRHSYLGYCFTEEAGSADAELERFLSAGPPPVYFGFGSVGIRDPRRLTRTILEAALRAGCRAIVARGWSGLGQSGFRSAQVLVTGEQPHHLLFPRLAAVVHHGGSGTVHSAARAGVPQLALPQIADQYYWARRVHVLGLGPAPFPLSRVSVGQLSRSLVALMRPGHRSRASEVATRMAGDRGVERAVEVITGERPATGVVSARCSRV